MSFTGDIHTCVSFSEACRCVKGCLYSAAASRGGALVRRWELLLISANYVRLISSSSQVVTQGDLLTQGWNNLNFFTRSTNKTSSQRGVGICTNRQTLWHNSVVRYSPSTLTKWSGVEHRPGLCQAETSRFLTCSSQPTSQETVASGADNYIIWVRPAPPGFASNAAAEDGDTSDGALPPSCCTKDGVGVFYDYKMLTVSKNTLLIYL